MLNPRSFLVVFAALSMLLARPALAQGTAAAEVLFEEGRRLLKEGKYEQACPKLAESYRLDPGAGTALNLADCYEKMGRTASAWAAWLEAATLARNTGQADRVEYAQSRAHDLEPRLIRLVIDVPATSRMPGLEIMRDGQPIGEPSWSVPIPVDPGSCVLEARAPGYEPWRVQINVPSSSNSFRVTVPKLQVAASGQPGTAAAPAPGLSPAPDGAPPPQSSPAAPGAPTPSESSVGSGQRVLGAVIAGVGVVGLIVGTVFALNAMSQYDDSLAECPINDNRCTPEGVDIRDDARSSGNIATAGFAVGLAGVAIGGTLYFLAPSSPSTESASGRRSVSLGVGIGGAF